MSTALVSLAARPSTVIQANRDLLCVTYPFQTIWPDEHYVVQQSSHCIQGHNSQPGSSYAGFQIATNNIQEGIGAGKLAAEAGVLPWQLLNRCVLADRKNQCTSQMKLTV